MDAIKSSGRRHCAALWCDNFSGGRVDREISFLSFPTDPVRAREWARFCLRNDLISQEPRIINRYYVCDMHFKEEDFWRKFPSPILVPTAVPSVVGGSKGGGGGGGRRRDGAVGNQGTPPCTSREEHDYTSHTVVRAAAKSPVSRHRDIILGALRDLELMVMKSELSPSVKDSSSAVSLSDASYKERLCRMCFRAGGEMTGIFAFKEFDLKQVVEGMVHFKVNESDDYPDHVCELCLPKLMEFKRFKDQFLESKELFDRELTKHGKTVDKGCLCLFDIQVMTHPEVTSKMPDNNADRRNSSFDRSKAADDQAGVVVTAEEEEEGPVSGAGQNAETDDPSDCDDLAVPEEFGSDFQVDGGDSDGSDDLPTRKRRHPPKEPRKKMVDGKFRCSLCDELFEYQNQKDEHMKVHEQSFLFPCPECDRRYESLMKLNQHIVCHSDYRPYECETCSRRFRSTLALRRHKVIHSVVREHLCPHCGKDFRDYTTYLRHIKCHREKKAYACQVCGMEFSIGAKLKLHMDRHSTERPFVCELCGSKFASSSRLGFHKKRVHGPPGVWDCDVCGKTFTKRHTMTEHRRRHFNKRPPRVRVVGGSNKDVSSLN